MRVYEYDDNYFKYLRNEIEVSFIEAFTALDEKDLGIVDLDEFITLTNTLNPQFMFY